MTFLSSVFFSSSPPLLSISIYGAFLLGSMPGHQLEDWIALPKADVNFPFTCLFIFFQDINFKLEDFTCLMIDILSNQS